MDKTVVTIGDQRYVLVPEWVWDEIIGATSAAEVMMPAAQPQVQSQWPPTMLTRQVPAPIVSVMENTTELIFEDAPPSVNIKTRPPGSTPFTSWLLALRDYQGKTVKYPEPVNPGVSFQVNRGKYAGIETASSRPWPVRSISGDHGGQEREHRGQEAEEGLDLRHVPGSTRGAA